MRSAIAMCQPPRTDPSRDICAGWMRSNPAAGSPALPRVLGDLDCQSGVFVLDCRPLWNVKSWLCIALLEQLCRSGLCSRCQLPGCMLSIAFSGPLSLRTCICRVSSRWWDPPLVWFLQLMTPHSAVCYCSCRFLLSAASSSTQQRATGSLRTGLAPPASAPCSLRSTSLRPPLSQQKMSRWA